MDCESKVSLKYTITDDDDDRAVIVDHETGDSSAYLRFGEFILGMKVGAVEELSKALEQIAIKMHHEETEAVK